MTFDRLDLELVAVTHVDGNDNSKRAIETYVEQDGGQHDGLLRQWLAGDAEVYDCHRYTIGRIQYEWATEREATAAISRPARR